MINFKKIGFLEILVLFSAFYVVSTLIWTASTRSKVEDKANSKVNSTNKINEVIFTEEKDEIEVTVDLKNARKKKEKIFSKH